MSAPAAVLPLPRTDSFRRVRHLVRLEGEVPFGGEVITLCGKRRPLRPPRPPRPPLCPECAAILRLGRDLEGL